MQILSQRLKEVSKPDKSRDSHVFVRQLLWVPELMSSIWEFFNKVLYLFPVFSFLTEKRLNIKNALKIMCLL